MARPASLMRSSATTISGRTSPASNAEHVGTRAPVAERGRFDGELGIELVGADLGALQPSPRVGVRVDRR